MHRFILLTAALLLLPATVLAQAPAAMAPDGSGDPAANATTDSTGSGQKKVLLLYSVRRDTQLAVLGDQEMPRILNDALGTVDLYSEYMDVPRFSESEPAFREYLELKYNRRSFDLVISVQDVASVFVRKHRNDLFPGAPVLFAATEPPRVPNSSGIRLTVDLTKTIALATALQPDTRQVFVVNGVSSRDAFYERMAHTQLQPFEGRLAFTYLSHLSVPELERRLATLPEHSIVYYLLFYQDVTGQNFEPLDYLALVRLMRRARLILTDSGGIQEEAPTFGKPVLVLREKTERPEAVDAGVATLAGTPELLAAALDEAVRHPRVVRPIDNLFGRGDAGQRIVQAIRRVLGATPQAAAAGGLR